MDVQPSSTSEHEDRDQEDQYDECANHDGSNDGAFQLRLRGIIAAQSGSERIEYV